MQFGERRPRYDGCRGACHKYVPELSGGIAGPDNSLPSSPILSFSLHPAGGAPHNANEPFSRLIAHRLLHRPDMLSDTSSFHVLCCLAGFCAISKTLPVPERQATEVVAKPVSGAGVNAEFGDQLHFVAAEPHSTFLRVGVADNATEVAYEIAVLGRLRRGYRVLQLRGPRGTRIELSCLFVRIISGDEPHLWPTPSQVHALLEPRPYLPPKIL